jgi:hypothetical protein
MSRGLKNKREKDNLNICMSGLKTKQNNLKNKSNLRTYLRNNNIKNWSKSLSLSVEINKKGINNSSYKKNKDKKASLSRK